MMSLLPDAARTFTLRVWPELVEPESIEWRGRIQHHGSGETRYFRDWATLIAFIQCAETEWRNEP